jgi:ribosomal protein S20
LKGEKCVTTEAQKRATKKWRAANREKKLYTDAKAQAKRFVKMAKKEDLDELEKIIAEKQKKL